MSKKQVYKQLDPISHVLQRSDMYCGSKRFVKSEEYISNKDFKIEKKNINKCPAMIRVFIEILSNAIDNVERSKLKKISCKKIKVNFNQETQELSVWNDGDIIPIELNEEQNCYNHSMIFGKLLTGSNYDDKDDRTWCGRNGLGSKLCNIFSKSFVVEACDPFNKKQIKQTWTNNMRETTGPVVKSCKLTKGYTKVTWILDFEQFDVEKYPRDIIKLYLKYIIDAAVVSDVNVYFNDVQIPVSNLQKYTELYCSPTTERINIKYENSEVILTTSDEFEMISFVNGVFTKLGGTHVDSWCECIFRPIIDKLNKKDKKTKSKSPKININDVKKYFRIFVVCKVVRPEFDSQDKNRLESPTVPCSIKPSQIHNIMRWSVIDHINELMKTKDLLTLKKIEKSSKRVKIDSYDSANKAGTKYSYDCTLIICEGLSAKTYAVAGIEHGVYDKKGRDWFGILPLTGKILNVRNSNPSSIASNKVVTNIIQALGLKHGSDYTKPDVFKTLNYGKLMIMTDADCDGIHIEGLLINLFHALFPTLLKRDEPFIVSMKTPIARVINNKHSSDKLFYDETRFNNWLQNHNEKLNIKYYKGLGTTKTEDVPDTFGLKMVEYVQDETTDRTINKVFSKEDADQRKNWLSSHINNNIFSLDDQGIFTSMSITQFLNQEMIKFSLADCGRSIPNSIDGLKESQRKILYSVKKKSLKYSGKSMKVAQLSGFTAEHSNYHHGEQNLQDTIVGMAYDFVGSNNIPLLYRDGQFGTRLDGGDDSASARYIFTKMDMLTEYIFRSDDDCVLNYVNDDGDRVQPEFYVPIIPMILINGCSGIGTGWSSNIPCYNPLDLTKSIKLWLNNSELPEIHPWYRGFNGVITYNGKGKYSTFGTIKDSVKTNEKVIKELPIGMWTNKFKDFCEDLLINKKINKLKNYSGPTKVHFEINENDDKFDCNIKNLKLESYLYTTNMVLFDSNGKITKYKNINDIITSFCEVRLDYYRKRKKHQLSQLRIKLEHISNKCSFIQAVVNKNIKILGKSESYIIEKLVNMNFDKENDSYDYLLNISLKSITVEKVNEIESEKSKLSNAITTLEETDESSIWLKELEEFETQYNIFLNK